MAAYAQDAKPWSEADRKYLLDNLMRSREELMKETQNLSKEQWSFKESADRWSINQNCRTFWLLGNAVGS